MIDPIAMEGAKDAVEKQKQDDEGQRLWKYNEVQRFHKTIAHNQDVKILLQLL